ncbi:MAG: M48 family metallopeptidase [Bacteroidetes bacterium]|nr:M48 family metallopeptidase [Bacteroidota bacterium]
MKKNIFLFASIILISSCHKNVVTGKYAFDIVPESEMMSMSFSQYDQVLKQTPPLPDSDDRVQMVRRIGTRIQKSVESFFASKGASSDLNGFKWEFNVIDEATVNAWCMPGGKVVVYTGLLPITKDEPSLSIVMGHEIAHAVARHGSQRMSTGLLEQFGGAALSVALSQKPAVVQQLFNQAYGVTSGLGALKFSRSNESEADKMGLIFAAMAGYNPEVAIPFWQRMSQSGGKKPPEFLSTHPSDETRIKDLEAFMPEAKKYYKPQ